MSPPCTQQKQRACKSCPWTRQALDRGYYFDPNHLDKTTVQYLREERLHPCHSKQTHFCTGYLSHIVQYVEGGIDALAMGRLAIFLKLLDPDRIPTIPVFDSISKMLSEHQEMCDWQKMMDDLD